MTSEKDRWKPCPPGELEKLHGRLKKKHQRFVSRRRILSACAGAIGLGIGVGVSGLVFRGSAETIRRITCAEASDFMLVVIEKDGLNSTQEAELDQHLTHCRHCLEIFDQLKRKHAVS